MKILSLFLFIALIGCATTSVGSNGSISVKSNRSEKIESVEQLNTIIKKSEKVRGLTKLVDQQNIDEANPYFVNDSTIIYQRREIGGLWQIYKANINSGKSALFYSNISDIMEPKLDRDKRYLIALTYEDSSKVNRDIIVYDTDLERVKIIGKKGSDDYNVSMSDDKFFYVSNRGDQIKKYYDKDEVISLHSYNFSTKRSEDVAIDRDIIFYLKERDTQFFVDSGFILNISKDGSNKKYNYKLPIGSVAIDNDDIYCLAYKNDNTVICKSSDSSLEVVIDEKMCGLPSVRDGRIVFHTTMGGDYGIYIK